MVSTLKQWFYFFAGIIFLVLSKAKYLIFGYSPKPISSAEFEKCSAYDIAVVTKWTKHLARYTGESQSNPFHNKTILELGPGSDLGVGLYLLSKSAKEYHAVDVYNLVETTPAEFYSFFFTHLAAKENIELSAQMDELRKTKDGNSQRLNYHWSPDFNIAKALGNRRVDLILSNAAFEHFDNIERTIKDFTAISEPGTILIASVDLQTHSRWIREKDPNNIYRYPNWLFGLLSFKGTPNRVRPHRYKEALERNGWGNVCIEPETTLDQSRVNSIHKHLDSQFRKEENQMSYTSIWIFATKQ